ncbi:MAG: alpha/beta hydrolase [Burkholderiales bacterium]|nr:alpha/beta hydrolase [Burkholderiales bacterium]
MPNVSANGTLIEYESFGDPTHPPVLLIMGLGLNLLAWPEALVRHLVEGGHRVILFDNRDAGLSQSFDHLGVPNVVWMYLRHKLGLPITPVYTLDDMVADAVGLLDALGIERAHIVGASMGGMIAQNLAARHPGRVLSLTSMMSTTGNRKVMKPRLRALKVLLAPPAPRSRPDLAARRLAFLMRTIGSSTHPPDARELQALCERHVQRSYRPAGMARQLVAVGAADDRSAIVRTISRPTLVLHGDEDPLLPPPCARDTAALIPDARLTFIRGMGHDFPKPLLREMADHLLGHFRAHGAASAG